MYKISGETVIFQSMISIPWCFAYWQLLSVWVKKKTKHQTYKNSLQIWMFPTWTLMSNSIIIYDGILILTPPHCEFWAGEGFRARGGYVWDDGCWQAFGLPPVLGHYKESAAGNILVEALSWVDISCISVSHVGRTGLQSLWVGMSSAKYGQFSKVVVCTYWILNHEVAFAF